MSSPPSSRSLSSSSFAGLECPLFGFVGPFINFYLHCVRYLLRHFTTFSMSHDIIHDVLMILDICCYSSLLFLPYIHFLV
jgi:hypothetical protein